jgi:hypothetical protein
MNGLLRAEVSVNHARPRLVDELSGGLVGEVGPSRYRSRPGSAKSVD